MNWRLKAAIQNAIAMLPGPLSQRVYYAMQRRFGGLRAISVEDKLRQGVEIAARAAANGQAVAGAAVLEVGTGRRLNLPISLWLQGAASVVSVDLNAYLRAELVHEDLRQIRDERDRVEALFGPALRPERLQALVALADDFQLDRLLATCAIRYAAPGDASALDLAEDSIDLHVSYEVLEHIPGPVLEAILREGNRVVRPGGLFVHRIDFSDHFAHADPGISAINFLKFSDAQFHRLAGNRFMYMNRLRLDDFVELYARSGHVLAEVLAAPDPDTLRLLEGHGLAVHDRFAGKSLQTLATLAAWICSRTAATADRTAGRP